MNSNVEVGTEKKAPTVTLDRGAMEHAANDLRYFKSLERIPDIKLELADGRQTFANHKNIVHINPHGQRIILKETYYTPTLLLNLLSCSRMDKHGINTVFANNTCTLLNRDDTSSKPEKALI